MGIHINLNPQFIISFPNIIESIFMSDFSDQWPIAKFVFRVTIKGSTISFQEISGLDQEAEILEYRHGRSKTLIKRKPPL